MRRALPDIALALAACALLLAIGGLTPAFTDFEVEAEPAIRRLLAGDLGGFVQALPAYGGSVVLRAPFAVAAGALGGGDVAVFRALAIPCVAAAALLAVLEAQRLRDAGRPRLDRLLLLGLVACNPVTIRALDVGHPEELLVGVLCVAAVLLGLSGRAAWAGIALGVAAGAKPWAVVAAGPVLLSVEGTRARTTVAALGAGMAALVFARSCSGARAPGAPPRSRATAASSSSPGSSCGSSATRTRRSSAPTAT